VPPPEVVARFADFAAAVFSRVTANERQARSLAELRDTLLPRLLSGNLPIQQAQIQAEEAFA
jgi:type I restriction enzyme S subunit